jgi:hypothetical protein
MIIDCGSCAVAGLACDDCVVSVLLGAPQSAPSSASADLPVIPLSSVSEVTDVADEHAAALAVLADSGLVPPLRLVPRTRAG